VGSECTGLCILVLAFGCRRPNARDRRKDHDKGAFLFPQMIMPDEDVGAWSPGFVDYFFLAFNTSTASRPPTFQCFRLGRN